MHSKHYHIFPVLALWRLCLGLCPASHSQVRRYAAELVCVLHHLHDNGVVYVDLKPENVLLQDCGHIMLCDMDLVHTQTEIEHLRELEAGVQWA